MSESLANSINHPKAPGKAGADPISEIFDAACTLARLDAEKSSEFKKRDVFLEKINEYARATHRMEFPKILVYVSKECNLLDFKALGSAITPYHERGRDDYSYNAFAFESKNV